ncbi:hypothetical protein FNV43_RR15174 [Rhamnella rubrinervis]|uniref:Uncharacterized protein n=1 Tax=Rhamnella rubrinervis TaxID=2594499 RepID=A0A8K0E2V9_9ROSA|nr:hypothetical protein FNV43_RR15174 [Rhamnella rubrinervis]
MLWIHGFNKARGASVLYALTITKFLLDNLRAFIWAIIERESGRLSFDSECLKLLTIPTGTWYCKNCQNLYEKEKFVERNANAVATGRVPGIDSIEQITNCCIHINLLILVDVHSAVVMISINLVLVPRLFFTVISFAKIGNLRRTGASRLSFEFYQDGADDEGSVCFELEGT